MNEGGRNSDSVSMIIQKNISSIITDIVNMPLKQDYNIQLMVQDERPSCQLLVICCWCSTMSTNLILHGFALQNQNA